LIAKLDENLGKVSAIACRSDRQVIVTTTFSIEPLEGNHERGG
jgi:hypothetical protein